MHLENLKPAAVAEEPQIPWNVIVCEPQREQRLAAALAVAGHGVIAPTYTAWKIRRRPVGSRHTEESGRWFSRERVLIPYYLFSTVTGEELHAFRRDGGIRVITGPQGETMRFLAAVFTDWATGAYNDPEPQGLKPKPAPMQNRNRKTRRAGQARRQALDWHDGLMTAKTILDGQNEQLDIAA